MTTHRVAVLALPGVGPLDLAIPAQVFMPRPGTPYQVMVCGPARKVSTTSGFSVVVDGDLADARAADTIIVPGFEPVMSRLPARVLDDLATARERGQRVVSICTGAFALARAGVLDGRRATTHWQYVPDLERHFPAVQVERDVLYVDEGDVFTSAGVCCGIDLCLHIVRRDLGASTANQVARGLVAAPHRDGGQAQFVPAPLTTVGASSLAPTRAWALDRLGELVTVPELARHAGMSQRSFLRRFTEETGTTPLKWLASARVGRARELLETTELSVDQVAEQCGLGTAANLRLHFRRTLDTTPTTYRRAFARNEPARVDARR